MTWSLVVGPGAAIVLIVALCGHVMTVRASDRTLTSMLAERDARITEQERLLRAVAEKLNASR